MTARIRTYYAGVSRMIKQKYPEADCLQQVGGIGPITSLTYVLTLEKPERFAKSRDVGCYLGLAPILTHSRWCLLKRPENLTAKQEIKLSDLLRCNLKAIRSYLLKEDFQFFWDYASPHWAGVFLDRCCRRAIKSRIKPMQKVARMLGSHRELLLNWFRARKVISSDVIEGFNNKLKLNTRKSYGFRTFRAAEVMLYHTLGDLPEPECTHKFC